GGAPHGTTPMRKPSLPEKRHTSPPHVRVLRPCGWAPGMSGGFKSLGQASFLSGPPRGPVLRFSEAHANLHARPMGPTTPTGRPSILGAPRGVFRPARLLADAEAADERPVPLRALAPEVVEQAAALTDELEQTAAGVVVLLVGLEVLGELADAGAQQGDLDLGGPGIRLMGPVLGDQLGLLINVKRHGNSGFPPPKEKTPLTVEGNRQGAWRPGGRRRACSPGPGVRQPPLPGLLPDWSTRR